MGYLLALLGRMPESMRLMLASKNFLCSEEAATAIEYAFMLAMILVAVMIGVTSMGGRAGVWWTNIKTALLGS